MRVDDVEAVFRSLEGRGVRFLVAGGTAVVAYGYGRLTYDLDLVIQLEPHNIVTAFEALGALGYQPRQPVTAVQFADASLRRDWIENKNMQVLNFYSDRHRATSIDVFVVEPFDFPEEYARATTVEMPPGVPVRLVSLQTLIEMKEAVGRPRDLDDAWHLRRLQQEKVRDKED